MLCHCTPELEHCEPDPDPEKNGSDYCKNATYCFVAREFAPGGHLLIIQGCRENEKGCYTRRPDHTSVSDCCNSANYCNNETMIKQLNFRFPLSNSSLSSSTHVVSPSLIESFPNLTILYTSVVILFIFVLLLLLFICKISRSRKSPTNKPSTDDWLMYWCPCYSFTSWLYQAQSPMTEMCNQQPMLSSSNVGERYNSTRSDFDVSFARIPLSNENETAEPSSSILPTQQTYVDMTNTISNNGDTSISGSGSGRGQPLLVPQTVARSVQLLEVVGRGRYGEVWKGDFCGEQVAVKIFASRDEASWHREAYVFNQTRLRHDNIVNFYAADVFGRGSTTELWLIISYYKHGSLFDYLLKNVIDLKTLLHFASSAARGLHYLHSSIGTKPAMAHRDIKSKNLLVRDDFSLCIADLGLVAIESEEIWKPQFGENKVGTRRYLAPEMLVSTSSNCFIAFIRADIYSFALVLWEMLSRLTTGQCFDSHIDYRPPFFGMVSSDPSVEEMCEVIIAHGARPPLPIQMCALSKEEGALLERYWRLVCESWDGCPENRPLSLLMKKTLFQLENSYNDWLKSTRNSTNHTNLVPM